MSQVKIGMRRRSFLRAALGATTAYAAGRLLGACGRSDEEGDATGILGAFGLIQAADGTWTIHSDGLPRHNTGVFPNQNIPLPLRPQDILFRCSQSPTLASQPLPLELLHMPGRILDTSSYPDGVFAPAEGRFGYEFGVALNGIPFNPNGPWYQMNAALGWQFNVLKSEAFVALGLDENHGHPKIRGQYHYHGIPRGLVRELRRLGYRQDELLIGLAADGFPIYHNPGVDSSYRLKPGMRPAGGPPGAHDGSFAQDYEFVSSTTAGALDECNGRFGPTPEFPDGIYHYYITRSFPQIPRKFRGIPDISFTEFGPSSACAPLPDRLWAFGGLSPAEVTELKAGSACLRDPNRPDETAGEAR